MLSEVVIAIFRTYFEKTNPVSKAT